MSNQYRSKCKLRVLVLKMCILLLKVKTAAITLWTPLQKAQNGSVHTADFTAPCLQYTFLSGWRCGNLSQLNKLKSGSQKRKVKKNRERRQSEGSQVLTNFSKEGEHKHWNPISVIKQRQPKARADNRLHFQMMRPWLLRLRINKVYCRLILQLQATDLKQANIKLILSRYLATLIK